MLCLDGRLVSKLLGDRRCDKVRNTFPVGFHIKHVHISSEVLAASEKMRVWRALDPRDTQYLLRPEVTFGIVRQQQAAPIVAARYSCLR
jgi:hypothetical protein